MKNDNLTMNRKEFLKLSSGIIGGLTIPGVFGGSASAAETKATNGAALAVARSATPQ